MQKNSQGLEQPITFTSQSLYEDAMKYSLIKKHAYSLVKVVEKFRHLILGKQTKMRTPLLDVKFPLSQNLMSRNFAHCLNKI